MGTLDDAIKQLETLLGETEPPPRPSDFIEALSELGEQLQKIQRVTEPLTPRADLLHTLLRLVEAGKGVVAIAAGEPTIRRLAIVLGIRDIARQEQDRAATYLRYGDWPQHVRDVLQFYAVRLAQVEAQSMMAIAYIDTEREGPDGLWWANAAGEGTMQFVADFAEFITTLPAAVRATSDETPPGGTHANP